MVGRRNWCCPFLSPPFSDCWMSLFPRSKSGLTGRSNNTVDISAFHQMWMESDQNTAAKLMKKSLKITVFLMEFCEAFVAVCFPFHHRVCNNINQTAIFSCLIYAITDTTVSHHHPVSHIIIFHFWDSLACSFSQNTIQKFCSEKKERKKEKTANNPRANAFFHN